jgi:hypothetical protein
MALVSCDVTSTRAAHHEQNRAAAGNSREQEGQRVIRKDQSYRLTPQAGPGCALGLAVSTPSLAAGMPRFIPGFPSTRETSCDFLAGLAAWRATGIPARTSARLLRQWFGTKAQYPAAKDPARAAKGDYRRLNFFIL